MTKFKKKGMEIASLLEAQSDPGRPWFRREKRYQHPECNCRCLKFIVERSLRSGRDKWFLRCTLRGMFSEELRTLNDENLWEVIRNQSMIKCIKKAGEKTLRERKTQAPMEIVEMDELYIYVKKRLKNTDLDCS